MIHVESLTKRFGPITAVDDLSFSVREGTVTGFLGPNGSGKTTTLRMLVGLVSPDAGTATVDGRSYASIPTPMRVVGTALEPAFHPGRSGIGHLSVYAPAAGASKARCHELLELVGLGDAAQRRVGGYSMGMRQRLALATALLGDPTVLLLDEPANGLDPEGIVWLRRFLQHLAHEENRTVLVSSHVLAEVQAGVDDVVIISRGRLVHAAPLHDLVAMSESATMVAGADDAALGQLINDHGWQAIKESDGFRIRDVTPAQVGAAAFRAGVELHRLEAVGGDLEQVFLELTHQDQVV